MFIQMENQEDRTAIHAINEMAFESPAEANLVDALREQVQSCISLVAEQDGEIVGHIMFSPVTLSDHTDLKIMGLAPMAVAPKHQRKGIGSELVEVGLEQCKKQGYGAVVVLGHPEYYPRFGFLAASDFNINCEYEVPKEVFMLIELQSGYLHGKSGVIKYHSAFSDV